MNMKNKLVYAVAAFLVLVLSLWVYQAKFAENLLSIDIPLWVAGTPMKRYSIAIHKSQIRPFCTLWTEEYFRNPFLDPH